MKQTKLNHEIELWIEAFNIIPKVQSHPTNYLHYEMTFVPRIKYTHILEQLEKASAFVKFCQMYKADLKERGRYIPCHRWLTEEHTKVTFSNRRLTIDLGLVDAEQPKSNLLIH